jgi:hypothetical protein
MRNTGGTRCSTCQTPKPGGGGGGSRSGGGGGSRPPWQCGQCTYQNGSGTSTCGMCNLPRS